MIPVGAPTATFSARRPMRASAARSAPTSHRSFSATAVAISIAADEDSPAPTGTSESTARSNPRTAARSVPASPNAQTTPKGYADQPENRLPAMSSRVVSIVSPPSKVEAMRTRRSSRSATATWAARSIAKGSTNPSL